MPGSTNLGASNFATGATDAVLSALSASPQTAPAAMALQVALPFLKQGIDETTKSLKSMVSTIQVLGSAMGEKTITDFISQIRSGGTLGATSWLVKTLREANDELRAMRLEAQQVMWLMGSVGGMGGGTSLGMMMGANRIASLATGMRREQIEAFQTQMITSGVSPTFGGIMKGPGGGFSESLFAQTWELQGKLGMQMNQIGQLYGQLISLFNIRPENLPRVVGEMGALGAAYGQAPQEFITNLMALSSATRKYGLSLQDNERLLIRFGDALQEGRTSIQGLATLAGGGWGTSGLGITAGGVGGQTFLASRLSKEFRERLGLAEVSPQLQGEALNQLLRSELPGGVSLRKDLLREEINIVTREAMRIAGITGMSPERIRELGAAGGIRAPGFAESGLTKEQMTMFMGIFPALMRTVLPNVPQEQTYESNMELLIESMKSPSERVAEELRGHKHYSKAQVDALMKIGEDTGKMLDTQLRSYSVFQKLDMVIGTASMMGVSLLSQLVYKSRAEWLESPYAQAPLAMIPSLEEIRTTAGVDKVNELMARTMEQMILSSYSLEELKTLVKSFNVSSDLAKSALKVRGYKKEGFADLTGEGRSKKLKVFTGHSDKFPTLYPFGYGLDLNIGGLNVIGDDLIGVPVPIPLKQFAVGGVVPGSYLGQPIPIIAHAGEEISPLGKKVEGSPVFNLNISPGAFVFNGVSEKSLTDLENRIYNTLNNAWEAWLSQNQ